MTNEQYYELIKPYEDASRVLSTRLEILNHSLYGDRSDAGPIHNIQGLDCPHLDFVLETINPIMTSDTPSNILEIIITAPTVIGDIPA